MSEQPAPTGQDEEIRLVEVLATVIRRRRWVLWTTGVGSLLALLVLFFLPIWGISLIDGPTYFVQATIRVSQMPTEIRDTVGFDFQALVLEKASNVSFVGDVYRSTLMTVQEAQLSKAKTNRNIRTLISKVMKVSLDSKSSLVNIGLKTDAAQQEAGVRFVKQLAEKLRHEVTDTTLPPLRVVMSNLEAGLASAGKAETQLVADLVLKSRALTNLLSDPNFPLEQVGPIEVSEDEPSISKTSWLGLFVIGSAFFGLLLAFLVEAVVKTRNDPANRELLRKAWKGE